MKCFLLIVVFLSSVARAGTTIEVGDPQIGSSLAGASSGSILFSDATSAISQNNSNLFWDATNLRLGIRTHAPAAAVDIEQNSASEPALILGNATDGGPLMELFDHGGTNEVTVLAPSAISVSYSLILPTTLGVSGGFLQVDPVGNMSTGSAVSTSSMNTRLAQISSKSVADVASTANLASISGDQTIDGVTVSGGYRVLLKDQTDNTTNGLYLVNDFGPWLRDASMPSGSFDGMIVTVAQGGTVNAGTVWLSSSDGSAITFTRMGHGPAIVSSTTNTSATCSASCTSPTVLTGGGCQNSGAIGLQNSYPSATTTWSCTYLAATGNCTAKAICE